MKKLCVVMLLASLLFSLHAQERKYGCYAVAFYNLENLFDTLHDAGKNDFEFLPEGGYKWTAHKYEEKLKNMSRVIGELATDMLPMGASVVGVSEVENARVLTDLVNQPVLKERGMQYVHIEGPDRRGVDCALLYNPRFFTPEKSFLQPYVYEPSDSAYRTRGFLTVQGKLAGDDVAVIVCHWPSRGAVSYYRERAGAQVRHLKDSLLRANPDMKVMIMGDFNDDPFDKSMADKLGAKRDIKKLKDSELYNPWWNILKKSGRGTLTYQGGWNLFDMIVLTPNLVNPEGVRDYSTLKMYKNEIFQRDYMMQTTGKYKGGPLRTTAGGVWLNGFSDHLPVITYLLKEMK